MRLCAAGSTSSQRNPRYCDSVVGRSILTSGLLILMKRQFDRRPSAPLVDSRPPSRFFLQVGSRDRPPQQRGHFFWNIDDDLGCAQLFRDVLILTAQFGNFFLDRIALGFRAAVLRRQGLEHAGVALSPPGRRRNAHRQPDGRMDRTCSLRGYDQRRMPRSRAASHLRRLRTTHLYRPAGKGCRASVCSRVRPRPAPVINSA
jgi:hypothetical protein